MVHTTDERLVFLYIVLYRKVLESDRNLMAPMCAGSLLTAGSERGEGSQHGQVEGKTIMCSYLSKSLLFHSVPFLPALPHTSGHLSLDKGRPYGFLS